MARIHELIRQIASSNPELAADVEREVDALSDRRAFGLNFERHTPEEVELPGRPVRRGDKVHVLPPRGETPRAEKPRMWRVASIDAGIATIERHPRTDPVDTAEVSVDDLVVVAEFRDPIYPGLVSTGKVERGGDKPYHAVINAENFHALQTLLFTHRGKVDAIYIDPPYNTGARDWKYNNDYVEGDDMYRHSKWLAFMERRLLLAKELLNPDDSVLIVTIDEKEYLRLGLLLEQTFPEARIQMISSVINPKGSARASSFFRTDEYLYFVTLGKAAPIPATLPNDWKISQDARAGKLRWAELIRSGSGTRRQDSPNQFYPIFVRNTEDGPVFHSVGDAYYGADWMEISAPEDCEAIWPIRADGSEGRWQNSAEGLRELIKSGYARLGPWRGAKTAVTYLKRGEQAKVEGGIFPIVGRKQDGSIVTDSTEYRPTFVPGTQWRIPSHNPEQGGTNLLKSFLPGRKFPFPKSLYAVEDALRFFVAGKPEAIILDFFSGSGSTTHAVLRLNKQDGGRRTSISVTNNEVSAEEQARLRREKLRPGDAEWEQFGICDYITKPRIKAAITGLTHDGHQIKGEYKFTDVFPMADGFEENVEFFTLTYEAPLRVQANRAFERIAPLLWLRAGSRGRRIEILPEAGWDIAEAYGVLVDLDRVRDFVVAVRASESLTHAFVVTDDERLFQAVVRDMPESVEPVRLYESYMTNFRIDATRAVAR